MRVPSTFRVDSRRAMIASHPGLLMFVLLTEPLPEDLVQPSAPPPPPPPSAADFKFNSLKIVLKKLDMEEYSERLIRSNVRRPSGWPKWPTILSLACA